MCFGDRVARREGASNGLRNVKKGNGPSAVFDDDLRPCTDFRQQRTEFVRSSVLGDAEPGETVFTTVLRIPANEGSKLTIRELDQISTTVPIVVFRGRFGTALLNSAALRKGGITRETASFSGVPVPKDQSGDLTGVNPPSGLTRRLWMQEQQYWKESFRL